MSKLIEAPRRGIGRLVSRIRESLTEKPFPTITINPAEGGERIRLEEECRRITQQPDLTPTDFSRFAKNMIDLLGGTGPDLRTIRISHMSSLPLPFQAETPVFITFEWRKEERFDILGTDETEEVSEFGWINVSHGPLPQQKPLVYEAFAHHEGGKPCIDIWVNRKLMLPDTSEVGSFLSGDRLPLESVTGLDKPDHAFEIYTPVDAARFCSKIFSIYARIT